MENNQATYHVYFQQTEYTYAPGDQVQFDVSMILMMTGVYNRIVFQEKDVEYTINNHAHGYTLDFTMPEHDVHIGVHSERAGLPPQFMKPSPIGMSVGPQPTQQEQIPGVSYWQCPTCGENLNTGKFCTSCGTQRPQEKTD